MPEVNIDINVVARQALSSLKSIEGAATKSNSAFATMGKAIVVVNQAFALAGKIWGKFSGAISDVVSAASVQQKAMNDLRFAMQAAGQTGDKAANDFASFAAELQKVTAFGDEVTISAGAMFSQLTKISGEGLKQATIAGQNLAATLGMDLETAMRMLAKSTEDSGSGLRRYGISVRKGSTEAETLANAINAINDKMGGKAQNEMNTFNGLIKALGNAWGDAKELVGFYIIENETLLGYLKGTVKVLSDLPKHIKEVVGWFNENSNALKDAGIALGIATGLYGVYIIAANGAAIATGALALATKAYVAIQAMTPWGLIIAAVAAIGAGVFHLSKNWDLVTAKMKVFTAATIEFMLPAINLAMSAISSMVGIFNKDLAQSIEGRKAELEGLAASLRASGETELIALQEQNLLKEEEKLRHEEAKTNIEATQQQASAANFQNVNKQLLVNNKSFWDTMRDQLLTYKKFENTTQEERVSNFKDTLGQIATLSTSNNRFLATIGKAAAISMATIDGIVAVQKALAAAPPPFNFALAALVGTATTANVAKIAGVKGFQDGGIVGGNSTVGDRQVIRANSGEMMLNRDTQEKMFQAFNSGSLGGQTINVTIQGNVLGEDSYIDELARKLSEAVRFRNVQLVAS